MLIILNNYWFYYAAIILLILGLYIVITSSILLRKLLGLAIFQASIIMLYVGFAKIKNTRAPILSCLDYHSCATLMSNPLPHVLMLTAIVVGVASMAVGLSLVIKLSRYTDTQTR